MSYFAWDTRFDLGVPEMDREHQRLIDLMNQLHNHHVSGAPKATIEKTLTALGNYTVTHFSHEEAYMEKIGYRDVKVHKLVHKDLLEKFSQHRREFERRGVLDEAFFSFLKRWLAAHIMGIDMKYSPHSAAAAHA